MILESFLFGPISIMFFPKIERLNPNRQPCLSRLKMAEKKKTELAQKSRKEIGDYLNTGKRERAKIRVEHIIREDYLVEVSTVDR